MKLEFYILGLLKINPSTGYDIKKILDTEGRFGRKRAPLSQIYNTLKRMVENGWVRFEEEQREGKPDIKIYHNTPEGEQAFMEYLCSPIEPPFRFRESDILYHNLLVSMHGGMFRPFKPQRSYMLIFNMGDGSGILVKNGFVWHGRTAFALKNFIDRKMMKKYQVSGEADE